MLTGLVDAYITGTPSSPFNIVIGSHTDIATLDVGSAVLGLQLPAPGANQGQVTGNGGNSSTVISLGTGGYDYAMVKWGQDSEFYYVHGLTGDLTLSNDVNKNGESHYDLWKGGTVPDGGTTVLFLGASLSGLAWLRRKLS
jgi:hypothetical protein